MIEVLSKKYYLIHAIYQWCIDSGLSPCILVLFDHNVSVPLKFVDEDNCILLDISPDCVRDFTFVKESISFYAVFDDVEQQVFIPVGNVLEIYAAENEEGMQFAFEKSNFSKQTNSYSSRKSRLRVVK